MSVSYAFRQYHFWAIIRPKSHENHSPQNRHLSTVPYFILYQCYWLSVSWTFKNYLPFSIFWCLCLYRSGEHSDNVGLVCCRSPGKTLKAAQIQIAVTSQQAKFSHNALQLIHLLWYTRNFHWRRKHLKILVDDFIWNSRNTVKVIICSKTKSMYYFYIIIKHVDIIWKTRTPL